MIDGEARRQEILAFITEFYSEHHYPPSVRQIGAAVGLSSSSTVQAHLDALVREGKIVRDPLVSRSIRVVA